MFKVAKATKTPFNRQMGNIMDSTKQVVQLDADMIEAAIKQLAVCVVTSEAPAILTKTRKLDPKTGAIISEAGGHLVRGTAENIIFNSMKEFAQFLDSAKTNQALIAATHTGAHDSVRVYSTKEYEKAGKPANAITRTNDNFRRSSEHNGILTLDCDDKRLSKEQFLNAVRSVIPLDELAYVYTTSSSSWLYVNDELKDGVKGQRLYIAVDNASLIKEAGEALYDRLWLADHGKYEVSKSGALLDRCIIDKAMFDGGARLDFVGGSHCVEPVTQKRPPAEYNEGRLLVVEKELKPIPQTGAERSRLEAKKQLARAEKADEVKAAKSAYCEAKGLENLAKQGNVNPTAEQLEQAKSNVLKALEGDDLTGEFVITLAKDKKQITVAELLANPDKYDGVATLDPIEPEYHNYSAKGKLYLGDERPTLHSFAHGSKVYRLYKQSRFIMHVNGNTAETTNATLQLMRTLPTFYDMGGQLVSVRGGRVIPMNEHLLSYELGSIAQYYYEKTDKEGKVSRVNIDPPASVVKQVLSMSAKTGDSKTQRGLKALKAVITAPTITADNHIVYKRGYDEVTQLYLDTKEDIPRPATKPTATDVKAAHDLLMSIIDTFKLKDSLDKSVVLSAFLTAVIRPSIERAPIFCFSAPTQGSGKTYLAECLGILATGTAPSITPAIQGNEAEIQKTLLSMLMNNARVIVWDNIMGSFNSATMAAFVTASTYSGRVLGASEHIELPNKALTVFTGNNLALYGDLPRRCITAHIDTGSENPLNTVRDLGALGGMKPDQFIKANRLAVVNACITIVRSYLLSGAHLFTSGLTDNKVASFEEWDTLARQPVINLASSVNPELQDVKQSIDANMADDPEKALLAELLHLLNEWPQGKNFTSKQLYDYTFNGFDIDPRNALQDSLNGHSAELRDVLSELCKRDKKITSRAIGKQLAYRKERRAGGLYLTVRALPNNRGNQFSIVNT